MNRQSLLRLCVPAAAALLGPAVAAAPALAAAPTAPTVTEVGASVLVGQTVKFKFTEPDDSQPAEFHWLLNSGELFGTATAGNGKATTKIFATTTVNRLEVYAVGADGSVGDTTTVFFTGTAPAAYANQDLDGDGRPDLAVVVGDTLLAADGKGTGGQVKVPAVDLGPDGNGVGGTFAGMQVITGKFDGGPFEDYLAYNPSTGLVLKYDGLGQVDETQPRLIAQNEETTWFTDWDGNNPIQLATAYNSGGQGYATPDLVGILGDATSGYHLNYYPSYGYALGYGDPVDTGAATPDGGSDWANWKLSSTLLPSGTAISLWNPSTGALYLWEGVTFDSATSQLTYTQYQLSAAFRTGAADTALRLTDFDADGVPDIWAVSAAGSVTAYRVSGLSATGTAKLKAKAPQPLG